MQRNGEELALPCGKPSVSLYKENKKCRDGPDRLQCVRPRNNHVDLMHSLNNAGLAPGRLPRNDSDAPGGTRSAAALAASAPTGATTRNQDAPASARGASDAPPGSTASAPGPLVASNEMSDDDYYHLIEQIEHEANYGTQHSETYLWAEEMLLKCRVAKGHRRHRKYCHARDEVAAFRKLLTDKGEEKPPPSERLPLPVIANNHDVDNEDDGNRNDSNDAVPADEESVSPESGDGDPVGAHRGGNTGAVMSPSSASKLDASLSDSRSSVSHGAGRHASDNDSDRSQGDYGALKGPAYALEAPTNTKAFQDAPPQDAAVKVITDAEHPSKVQCSIRSLMNQTFVLFHPLLTKTEMTLVCPHSAKPSHPSPTWRPRHKWIRHQKSSPWKHQVPAQKKTKWPVC